MMTFKNPLVRCVLATSLVLGLSTWAAAEKRPEKKEGSTGFSVMDSSEAQWGRRSINDSVYRGYTVNAVYLERGRQALPDSFQMYKPSAIGSDAIINSGAKPSPTTITVNGQVQSLPTNP